MLGTQVGSIRPIETGDGWGAVPSAGMAMARVEGRMVMRRVQRRAGENLDIGSIFAYASSISIAFCVQADDPTD